MPRLTKTDIQRWQEGRHFDSYERLGAHANRAGCWFTVWAPNAEAVSVIGAFNGWDPEAHPLDRREGGLWEGYVRGAKPGQPYKYRLARGGASFDKTDPYAFTMEPPTGSTAEGLAAVITDLDYDWSDADWMARRRGPEGLDGPLSVYEVHLGSWRKKDDGYSLGYREIAEPLADHVEELGFTHVELMPVAEHPYYGSWGYQTVGYYAPTFRYGTPQDFMYLVDHLHRRGIGVLLDWVPGHFAPDPQGLADFDGTPLFEYADPQMRHHPDWGTRVFDFGKPGVRSFLVSNALFWLDHYHIDGLRVDAVASMLYRDYSRGDQWSPNQFGGRENLEAIDLLQTVNGTVYDRFPQAVMIAEESTAWPGVTRPTSGDGLGFLYKWNMGWMHDTLHYMSEGPVHRRYHHNTLSFSLVYAYSEQYELPLSHHEVVHGKGSLWDKMPGDPWQKAAHLRLLYGHLFGHPGKKMLFMGSEFGQEHEWTHDHSLAWGQSGDPLHGGLMQWTRDLNRLYREHPALHSDRGETFAWIVPDDRDQSVLAYLRKNEGRALVFVFNFTPVPRQNYRIGVPEAGFWKEILNSDAESYGGSGRGNLGAVESTPVPRHGHPASLVLALPPLGMLVLEREEEA